MHKKTNDLMYLCSLITFKRIHCYRTTPSAASRRALTLPDSSTVDVDLHRIGGVERLVVVEDEDVTAQSMDTGRVYSCILMKKDRETHKSVTVLSNVLESCD